MDDDASAPLPTDRDASGRSLGEEELERLREVLASGTLICTAGSVVRELERRFAAGWGAAHCRALSSGTAAVHAAVAAVDPEPGDEVISSPITDMGAITPILYQAAIPVFADVDPETGNLTAAGIEAKISDRTRAVIVTHLFGNPCDMDPILELCAARGIAVIEDCAQAFLAEYRGRRVGVLGDLGCFSLQQGKHMTCGEGGLVLTSDAGYARRVRLFVDKAWPYGEEDPDHEFLALNYRMTELQGAVALAQFEKLEEMVRRRTESAARLTAKLRGLEGIGTPAVVGGARHVFWRYPLRVDPRIVAGGADGLGARLAARGVPCQPGYVRKPAFECRVLRERVTFGRSRFPFEGEHLRGRPPVVYDRAQTPGAVEALAGWVVLPWNERFGEPEVDRIANAVRGAAGAAE